MKTLSPTDRDFLEKFESCQLAASEFRHREHVRLAYIYLSQEPFGRALAKMELGLQRLLAHLGAPASKHHHTMTQAWLLAVAHFIHRIGPTDDFETFLLRGGTRLLDKEIMGSHYSTELLTSEEARGRFVDPDLEPIPIHQP